MLIFADFDVSMALFLQIDFRRSMVDPAEPSRNTERAIYLVGGLILFLWGLSSFVGELLNFYDALVPGPAPGAGSHFWVDHTVGLFVALIIIFAGLALVFLAWRIRRSFLS